MAAASMSLPLSFDRNTNERMVHFLNESNRIEGIHEVDYHNPLFQKIGQGHFGALVDSQQMALIRKPLAIRKVKEWQSLLTREQKFLGHDIEEGEIGHIRNPSTLPKNVRVGPHVPPSYESVPTLLEDLVERINEGLKDQDKLKDDLEYCRFLGRSFQEFESIHPFADGNGRTGRLIANYISTYCNRPIIVFGSDMSEKNRYYEAHKSKEAMARHMAVKVQDVIFGMDGKILQKKGASGFTSTYESLNKESKESYQWHSLSPLLFPETDARFDTKVDVKIHKEKDERKLDEKKVGLAEINFPFHPSNLNVRPL